MANQSLSYYQTIIRKIILSFSDLTKTHVFFLSTEHYIIDRERLIDNSQQIDDYFSHLYCYRIISLPVIMDYSLIGFFVLSSDSESETDNDLMLRSYLESTTNYYIKQDGIYSDILILNPIKKSTLQNYISETDRIKKTTSYASSNLLSLPPVPGYIPPTQPEHHDIYENISKALAFIECNLSKPLTLEEVAQQIFLSSSYLSRIFKKNFKVNFSNYINIRKIALAQQKLLLTTSPINKLAKQIGFSQASYFTKIFKQKAKVTPSNYRKVNVRIRKIYTIPRDLTWLDNPSVFDVSKAYFDSLGIPFLSRNLNGLPYIYSIGDLSDSLKKGGWVYTVDCAQPSKPSDQLHLKISSVIQWIYTEVV